MVKLGGKYGNLIVIRKTEERKNGYIMWECLCDWGTVKMVRTNHFEQISRFGKLEKIQARDKEKDGYCKEKLFPLIRIPYWEINNIREEVFV